MASEHFLRPTFLETLLNKTVGWLARLGVGPNYLHLLQVRGRKTGKLYSTPVNLIQVNGRLFLVGGRGHTAWSKNAAATGVVTLRRGRASSLYRVSPLPDAEKPAILKKYLETYVGTVQKFFDVPMGSPEEAFRRIIDRHPVFELSGRGSGG